MSNENMVKIIEWITEGSAECSAVYRLDEFGSGERFFRDMMNNAEVDGRESFKIREITQQEWQECCDRGFEQ